MASSELLTQSLSGDGRKSKRPLTVPSREWRENMSSEPADRGGGAGLITSPCRCARDASCNHAGCGMGDDGQPCRSIAAQRLKKKPE